jgi:hypothetical protein
MGWRERLADPWGALVAAVAGGLTWAVIPGAELALPLGAGVAVAVFGAKVAADALLGRRSSAAEVARQGPAELPAPPPGTPARAWLDRTRHALAVWEETVGATGDGATRAQLRGLGERAAGTGDAVQRLAGQATALEQALARIPAGALHEERDRLAAAVARPGDAAVRAEQRASLASVEHQLEVHARLSAARQTALARMQSTALGLESLNARALELLALAASSGHLPEGRVVDELAGEMEALRGGLLEAERITRPDLPR